MILICNFHKRKTTVDNLYLKNHSIIPFQSFHFKSVVTQKYPRQLKLLHQTLFIHQTNFLWELVKLGKFRATAFFNRFMHYGVDIVRSLKYLGPFLNIMKERVKFKS